MCLGEEEIVDKFLWFLIIISVSSLFFALMWSDVELKRIEADRYIGCVAYHSLKECGK